MILSLVLLQYTTYTAVSKNWLILGINSYYQTWLLLNCTYIKSKTSPHHQSLTGVAIVSRWTICSWSFKHLLCSLSVCYARHRNVRYLLPVNRLLLNTLLLHLATTQYYHLVPLPLIKFIVIWTMNTVAVRDGSE